MTSTALHGMGTSQPLAFC